MQGYRKLIMLLVIVSAAVFMPITDQQASVLIAVAQVTMLANAVEHIGGSRVVQEIRKRFGGSSGPVTDVPRTKKPWEIVEAGKEDTDRRKAEGKGTNRLPPTREGGAA